MADFCLECSILHFGEDTKDLAGLSTADDTARANYVPAICEGCGFIYVDHTGRCLGGDTCMEHHDYTRKICTPPSSPADTPSP